MKNSGNSPGIKDKWKKFWKTLRKAEKELNLKALKRLEVYLSLFETWSLSDYAIPAYEVAISKLTDILDALMDVKSKNNTGKESKIGVEFCYAGDDVKITSERFSEFPLKSQRHVYSLVKVLLKIIDEERKKGGFYDSVGINILDIVDDTYDDNTKEWLIWGNLDNIIGNFAMNILTITQDLILEFAERYPKMVLSIDIFAIELGDEDYELSINAIPLNMRTLTGLEIFSVTITQPNSLTLRKNVLVPKDKLRSFLIRAISNMGELTEELLSIILLEQYEGLEDKIGKCALIEGFSSSPKFISADEITIACILSSLKFSENHKELVRFEDVFKETIIPSFVILPSLSPHSNNPFSEEINTDMIPVLVQEYGEIVIDGEKKRHLFRVWIGFAQVKDTELYEEIHKRLNEESMKKIKNALRVWSQKDFGIPRIAPEILLKIAEEGDPFLHLITVSYS